jgi:hypothetical protein
MRCQDADGYLIPFIQSSAPAGVPPVFNLSKEQQLQVVWPLLAYVR